MDNFVLVGLGVSLCLNAYLGFRFYRKEHVLAVDAQNLLSQLARGKTVLKIEVLDTAALFLRSPRG
jgi:hypothetical protein